MSGLAGEDGAAGAAFQPIPAPVEDDWLWDRKGAAQTYKAWASSSPNVPDRLRKHIYLVQHQDADVATPIPDMDKLLYVPHHSCLSGLALVVWDGFPTLHCRLQRIPARVLFRLGSEAAARHELQEAEATSTVTVRWLQAFGLVVAPARPHSVCLCTHHVPSPERELRARSSSTLATSSMS